MIIFTILSSLFGGLFSGIKSLFSDLLAHPKIAAVLLVLALALGGGLYIKHIIDVDQAAITKLESQNTTLVAQNTNLTAQVTQLKADVATTVAVNEQDSKTITQLSAAKTDAQNRITEMQKQQQANATSISNLRATIAKSSKKDDGPVSNVLLETIKAIQQNRGAAQ